MCITQTDIFSGALFIQISFGWDLYLSTGILLLVTAIYTVAGKHTCTQFFVLQSFILNTDDKHNRKPVGIRLCGKETTHLHKYYKPGPNTGSP